MVTNGGVRPQPFEADDEQLLLGIETYVDVFIGGLQSFFVVMPRGEGFVGFERFKRAYDCLRGMSGRFDELSEDVALRAVEQDPLALVVLRTMTGLTAPELAHLACGELGIEVKKPVFSTPGGQTREGWSGYLGYCQCKDAGECAECMVRMAVRLLVRGASAVGPEAIHRLDKIDTKHGLRDVETLASGRSAI